MSLELVLVVAVAAALLISAGITPIIRSVAFRVGAVDEPTGGRKVHTRRTALWGGFGPYLALTSAIFLVTAFAGGREIGQVQLAGFAIALTVLLVGGFLDDRYSLPPWAQFCFPLIASFLIVASGSAITLITNPFGPNGLSLVWATIAVTPCYTFVFPADLVTVIWLLVVTYAMKFLDGLDGLVAGMTAIGALLIAGLAASEAYFQPVVAILALAVAAAYLGFLPWNRSGSIFLGEAGATIAGFSLGVLAIISGAKVATASAALSVPLVDIVLVVFDRLRRGASPFRGDTSHLHFRLVNAGFSSRTAVRIIWTIALLFGLIALTLQTKGKLFLLVLLVVLIAGISAYAKTRAGNSKT